MAPPKKNVKMDLNSFLNSDSFGSSWAEEDIDLNKITIPIENVQANTVPLEELAAAKRNVGAGMRSGGGGGSRLDPALAGGSSVPGRRDYERVEYPVPDKPPYRAIINNIPWDITPEGVKAWVEDGLQKEDAVEEIDLPRSDREPTRLKGMAFLTLREREDLVKALTFNATKLNERTVYVSVAAPRRDFGYRSGGGDDFDWGAARGSNFRGEPGREEVDLDWGAARGSNFQERRPKREEVDLDWGAARGSQFEERKPRREEVDLDWSAARGSQFQERKPRREEPDLDWGSARQSQTAPAFTERKPRKQEPELNWGAARGSKFQQKPVSSGRKAKTTNEPAQEKPKIQKSAFEVLANDDDDEQDDEDKQQPEKKNELSQLEKETAKLSVSGAADEGEWETTGKK